MSIVEEIKELKKQRNAVILAHYYVADEVQAIADYIGDSYYLAKVAKGLQEDTIVFAGVNFMGESAKILNPGKTVLMPDITADWPMAHMATAERIAQVRAQYEDVAVVCYVNSVASLKEHSDVIVTSANAMKIVKALPNKNIFFIPDENLGRYIASEVPEKNFIFNDGYCPIHKAISAKQVLDAKAKHKGALVLVHPESIPEVVELADYVGSTSGIIDFATASDATEYIIVTERGVLYELRCKNPDKKFYSVSDSQICADMKKVTLEKIRDCMKDNTGVIEVEDELRKKALIPLERMLELAK